MSKKENSGQFKPGNTIGEATRFKQGHKLSTKYKDKYVDSLLVFFSACDDFPTLEKWACSNGLAIRTVHDWISDESKYPQFALAYAQAKAIQKDKLINLGLRRTYDSSMVKFLLINNHDMTDKVEQKIEGETNSDITINIREVK